MPTPLGDEANTPEIIEAFEAAVADGMNVINFSGGGPQTDPANDAMYVAVHNTVLAGVVPVIAAGNDRDDFGLGTTGSPGTAPDAITVAATSNPNVFAPALSGHGRPAVARRRAHPGRGRRAASRGLVDARPDRGRRLDGAWEPTTSPSTRTSAAPPDDPNNTLGTLPNGSLKGKIALVLRGDCSFISKVERADARRRDRADPDRQPLRRGEPAARADAASRRA